MTDEVNSTEEHQPLVEPPPTIAVAEDVTHSEITSTTTNFPNPAPSTDTAAHSADVTAMGLPTGTLVASRNRLVGNSVHTNQSAIRVRGAPVVPPRSRTTIEKIKAIAFFVPFASLYLALAIGLLWYTGVIGNNTYTVDTKIVAMDGAKYGADLYRFLDDLMAGKTGELEVDATNSVTCKNNEPSQDKACNSNDNSNGPRSNEITDYPDITGYGIIGTCLVFYGEKCPHCRVFRRTYVKVPQALKQYQSQIKFAAVEVSTPGIKEIAKNFSVEYIPYILFFYKDDHEYRNPVPFRASDEKKYTVQNIVEFVKERMSRHVSGKDSGV